MARHRSFAARRRRPFKHRLGKRTKEQKSFQRSIPRFPRLKKPDELFDFLRQLREEYPLPHYSKSTDGSWNPGETVVSWLAGLKGEDLEERCLYHGLSEKGGRLDLIKRMYLHWRSAKLKIGFPLVAYTTDCEKYGPAECACGQMRADSSKIARFPRLRKRFPRLPRFPRLRNRFDPAIQKWWKQYRKWYKKETGRRAGQFELLFYND